jgi:hypothetical protein
VCAPICPTPHTHDTIDGVNTANKKEPYIQDAFCYCGLNPWSKEASLEAFKSHLDSLEDNMVMNAMLMNQKAVTLNY